MLGERAAQYFQNKDKQDPDAKKRREYVKVVLQIAESIAQMRKDRGLTQEELARLANTSQSTIALWESAGYEGYTLSKLADLANALDYKLTVNFFPKKPTTSTRTEEVHEKDWCPADQWENLVGSTATKSDTHNHAPTVTPTISSRKFTAISIQQGEQQ